MKIATVRLPDATAAVRLEGDRLISLGAADVGAFLRGEAQDVESEADLSAVAQRFLQPVLRPGKIFCVGLNYRRHIAEMGRGTPEFPTIFTKFAETLTGPHDDIPLSPDVTKLDWEAELCVIIGAPARRVSPEDALSAVYGYTIMNDVSMRDWQNRTTQWAQGKIFEASTPVGPVVVSADELPPGGAGLAITCEIDGETMQSDNTDDLLFDVAHLVSYLSHIISLAPGDLIATGTPGGVGAGSTPPRFMTAGTRMRTTIEGIGVLENTISPTKP